MKGVSERESGPLIVSVLEEHVIQGLSRALSQKRFVTAAGGVSEPVR